MPVRGRRSTASGNGDGFHGKWHHENDTFVSRRACAGKAAPTAPAAEISQPFFWHAQTATRTNNKTSNRQHSVTSHRCTIRQPAYRLPQCAFARAAAMSKIAGIAVSSREVSRRRRSAATTTYVCQIAVLPTGTPRNSHQREHHHGCHVRQSSQCRTIPSRPRHRCNAARHVRTVPHSTQLNSDVVPQSDNVAHDALKALRHTVARYGRRQPTVNTPS